MRITIPDPLADTYQVFADRQGRSLDHVVTAQLDRFQHCPPGERTLALSVDAAEKILGGPPVKDGQDLLKRLHDLAGISFHRISLDFTPAQLEELQRRATREEKDVEVLAKEIIAGLQRAFFWGSE